MTMTEQFLWISVKDDLPPMYETVAIKTQDGQPHKAFRSFLGNFRYYRDGTGDCPYMHTFQNVTHFAYIEKEKTEA